MREISDIEKMTEKEVDAAIQNADLDNMVYRDIVEFCPAVNAGHLDKLWDLVSTRTDTYETIKYSILNHHLVSVRILIAAVSLPEWVLRSAASRNLNLPLKYVMPLLSDPDSGVRGNAQKNLDFHVDRLLSKLLK